MSYLKLNRLWDSFYTFIHTLDKHSNVTIIRCQMTRSASVLSVTTSVNFVWSHFTWWWSKVKLKSSVVFTDLSSVQPRNYLCECDIHVCCIAKLVATKLLKLFLPWREGWLAVDIIQEKKGRNQTHELADRDTYMWLCVNLSGFFLDARLLSGNSLSVQSFSRASVILNLSELPCPGGFPATFRLSVVPRPWSMIVSITVRLFLNEEHTFRRETQIY